MDTKDDLSPVSYLKNGVLELYGALDPAAARELTAKLRPAMDKLGPSGPGAGGSQLSAEKLQELIKQMQKKNPPAEGSPRPSGPASPAPAGSP